MGATSVLRGLPDFVLLMEAGGDALTLDATRVLATSFFAQRMEVASVVGWMAATSPLLVDQPCAQRTEVVEGAMLKDATSLLSPRRDIVSSTAVAKSALTMDAKRLPVDVPNSVLLMEEASDANSRAATASRLGSCSSVELMVAVQE